ncbi:DUF1501 domain-containing protein [Curvibacter sp. CHRR-16]|uniref:DUF1501 domain-containing protein n=1 Tax=Curvibacter sp. CHRR-16 TaxID=2835872 RepID=UPI001BDAE2DF|nr:DUF1501 domain-containing protein [Curvibacter sp. CHRR-16]MBT0569168.1 DUF1501 domain-containing protein [Curvibacter sp. CHRR-16]
MNYIKPEFHSRRAFLRRAAQLSLAGTATPFALNLAAMGEAAAFTATDYKALVCVFLFGGNDYANTVITYDDDSYNKYAAIRTSIAEKKADLAATLLSPTTALAGGRQYALHPAMTGMAGLFNAGKAAVQLNVGPLIVPLTRAQYNSGNRVTYPIPPKLFSHNDQQSVWQSDSAEGSTVGWGGNMGDLALSSNTRSQFTCMSLSGGVFMSGDTALDYRISTNGAINIEPISGSTTYRSSYVRDALTSLIQQSRAHVLENEYNRVIKRSIESEAIISSAVASSTLSTAFSGDGLSSQLKMVARLINARNALGVKRQVFFVGLSGFDVHDGLMDRQPLLLTKVSEAMTSFYNATVEMGIANQVTAFTASDFGRTLSSNGDGSDHGWGGHHFMVGGAVKGKAFYGKAPPVSVGNTSAADDQWHVGSGRLLPSTSVDQYAATLASWFGVSNSELADVLPRLSNFGGTDYPTNLGFMAT